MNATLKDKYSNEYTVLGSIMKERPELCKLILNTESMDKTEKQYWFHVLPHMKEIHIERLIGILSDECRKLKELLNVQ